MNSNNGSYNKVEIDLSALAANFKTIRNAVDPAVRLMAIVKSDAYGHGLVKAAKTLAESGARSFGVAECEEGVLLREAGIGGEITVLLGADAEFAPEIIENDLQIVAVDSGNLKALSGYAAKQGRNIKVHLKVDTGMGRLGIMPEEVSDYLELLEVLPGVSLVGVMSHFPRADEPRGDYTDKQIALFGEIAAGIGRRFDKPMIHAANSAAIMNYPEAHFNMVRPGISLYGCLPAPESQEEFKPRLQPVMEVKTRVIQTKEVPAGYGISYGHTYRTDRPTRLAVLPIGYADGYLRRLAGKAEVIINGVRTPVLGRICMNACMADITGRGPVEVGDEVVVMGRQGGTEISADDIARWSDTISYEILCLFGTSNRRVYL